MAGPHDGTGTGSEVEQDDLTAAVVVEPFDPGRVVAGDDWILPGARHGLTVQGMAPSDGSDRSRGGVPLLHGEPVGVPRLERLLPHRVPAIERTGRLRVCVGECLDRAGDLAGRGVDERYFCSFCSGDRCGDLPGRIGR